MTTSEFIKLLQDEDPSGTAHIRMDGGFPKFAILKEAYYDGGYSYINGNNEYVTTNKSGSKIDIYCMDIDLFVETNMNINITWEEIKNKFVFDFYGSEECVKEQCEWTLNKAKESFETWKEIYYNIDNNIPYKNSNKYIHIKTGNEYTVKGDVKYKDSVKNEWIDCILYTREDALYVREETDFKNSFKEKE